MDYRIGINLVYDELEEEIDNKMWDKWLMVYPHMTEENFMSFDEFKEEHKPKKPLNAVDKRRIDEKTDRINKKVKGGV